jgi:hypothetical protein
LRPLRPSGNTDASPSREGQTFSPHKLIANTRRGS